MDKKMEEKGRLELGEGTQVGPGLGQEPVCGWISLLEEKKRDGGE